MQKHLRIFFLLFACSVLAKAQQPVFRNFQVKDGLPSSEVYDVMQDTKGYMWFSTDAGVSRYDGYAFQNFSTQNGLPDNTIFGAYEDRKGRIWFRSFSGRLSYFMNDSIYLIGANEKFVSAIHELSLDQVVVESLCIDAGDTLWCGVGKSKGYYKIAPPYGPGNISFVPIPEEGYYVVKVDKTGVIWGTIQYPPAIQLPFHLRIFNSKQELLSTLPVKYTNAANQVCTKASNGDLLYINTEDRYTIHGDSCKKYVSPGKNITVYSDRDNTTWLGTFKGGVRWHPQDSSLSGPGNLFLNGLSVSGIEQDQEGGYWFSTLDNGVYYTPSVDLLYFDKSNGLSDNKVTEISCDQLGNIFTGSPDGSVYKISKQNKVTNIFPSGEAVFALSNGVAGRLFVGAAYSFSLEMLGKKKKYTDQALKLNSIKFFTKDHFEHNAWAANSGSFFKVNLLTADITSVIYSKSRIFSICYNNRDTIWLGCMDGLWSYSKGVFHYYGDKEPLLKNRIDDIVASADGTLWLGTKGAGLIIKKKDRIFQVTTANGLSGNICKTLWVDSAGTVWAGTNHGISSIKMERWKECSIHNYTSDDGLVTDEISHLLVSKNILWAATNQGVIRMDLEKNFSNSTPPPVYITAIEINSERKNPKDTLPLKYFENYIHIDFKGISYKRTSGITYRYQLEGLDSAWQYTQNTSVQYPTLPPGRYKFLVSARNNNGVWSSSPASVSFSIAPPFWSTWWFGTTMAGLFIGGVWYFFYQRFKKLKARNELEKQMIALEAKALRAQMNPHFIFNALNSIQSFISGNDVRTAEHYLASFAKLIRMILENSRQSMIPLTSEMQVLETYLKLEKLRFKNKFDYTIGASDELDPSTVLIPSMLLQPYVENAVLHGIMHKESGGEITVLFRKENKSIISTVEDNGLGRAHAASMKKQKNPGHRSAGTEITQERINILNQKSKTALQVKIIDKKDVSGNPSGTLVEVTLPFEEVF